jgi:putative SOS response-associated peptidase YedK
MCGRTTLTNQRLEDIAELLDAEFSPEDLALYRPRFNVAPSDTTWIAVSRGDARVVEPAVWGYVASKDRPKPLVNVRGEQVASGGGFREAFASRRCAIVTDGFYEWPAAAGPRAAPRAPYWFHRPEGGLILLAGLFQRAPAEAPGPPRFTILTTRPNATVARVHDRMPVVLPQARLDDWLAGPPARATPLIAPAPDDWLVATRVSRRANSPRNDDAACLAPATEADDDPQRSLF